MFKKKSFPLTNPEKLKAKKQGERKLEEKDVKTYTYFGFGSNMCLYHMIHWKHMVPVSVLGIGVVKDYKLSFEHHGYANMVKSKGDYVEGILMKLSHQDLERLTKMENVYDQRTITVILKDENKPVLAYVFIYDEETEKRLKKQSPIPFIEKTKIPNENYLDTLIVGAKRNGVSNEYIETYLSCFKKDKKYVPTKKFDTKKDYTNDILKEINKKSWKWLEIKKEINRNNRKIAVLKGVVVDLGKSKPAWAQQMNGTDMTVHFGKRWAFANEKNTVSLDTLEEKQKLFINTMCGIAIQEKKWFKFEILGKLEKNEKGGFDAYDW